MVLIQDNCADVHLLFHSRNYVFFFFFNFTVISLLHLFVFVFSVIVYFGSDNYASYINYSIDIAVYHLLFLVFMLFVLSLPVLFFFRLL